MFACVCYVCMNDCVCERCGWICLHVWGHVCLYVCVVCACVFAYVYVCDVGRYVCMCVICTCMFVCMGDVCLYVYMRISIFGGLKLMSGVFPWSCSPSFISTVSLS